MTQYFSIKQAQRFQAQPKRWNLDVGATRSGKTYVNYHILLKRAREIPKGNALLIGNTLGSLVRNVIEPMRELYGEDCVQGPYGRYNKVRLFGREFYTLGAHNESSYKSLQGIGLVYANGDEVGTWPESIINWLKSRLSEPGACFDGTANPEGPMHWLKKKWIDKADELDLDYWHYVLDDNPFLDPGFVASLKSEYTGVWYQRLVLGLWVAAEGAIYDMLDTSIHVVDELPQMKNYWVGVDYGSSGVTTFWLLGYGVDGCLYVSDFYRHDVSVTHKQKTDVQFGEDMSDWLEALNITPQWIFVPNDAASFIAQLYSMQKGGKHPRLRNLARADQSPGSVLKGIRTTASLLGQHRLKFARSIEKRGGLVEWINYAWDAKKQARGEDAPLKVDDHSVDAARYAIFGTRAIWQKRTNN